MFARFDVHPNGAFWTLPQLIGSTDDEVAALGDGKLSEQRVEAMAVAAQCACRSLELQLPKGRC